MRLVCLLVTLCAAAAPVAAQYDGFGYVQGRPTELAGITTFNVLLDDIPLREKVIRRVEELSPLRYDEEDAAGVVLVVETRRNGSFFAAEMTAVRADHERKQFRAIWSSRDSSSRGNDAWVIRILCGRFGKAWKDQN